MGVSHGVLTLRVPVIDLDEFPRIGHPAIRSLRAAGYRSLGQLAGVPSQELAGLDNVGPKSLAGIQSALERHGLTLA